MGVLNTTGDVEVLLGISAVDHARETSPLRDVLPDDEVVVYHVASSFVRELVATTTVGGRHVALAHRENTRVDLTTRGLYAEDIPAVDAEALVAAHSAGDKVQFDLSVSVTHYGVFAEILREIGAEAAGTNTLANPSASAKSAIEKALPPDDLDSDKVELTADELSTKGANFRATLTNIQVFPKTGTTPALIIVNMIFVLQGAETFRPHLLAADWSALVGVTKPAKDHEDHYSDRRHNVISYLAAQIDLARGESLQRALVDKHKGGKYPALLGSLRDQIDEQLIVANYWGATEDFGRDEYQARVSALLGTITLRSDLAAIVYMLRGLYLKTGLPGDVALLNKGGKKGPRAFASMYPKTVLAAGVGHCNEHAMISFAALEELRGVVKGLDSVFQVADPTVDHTFLITNLQVKGTVRVDRSPDNPAHTQAPTLTLLDLDAALAGAKKPRLFDAYLEPSAQEPSVRAFVSKLQAVDSTTFIVFLKAAPQDKQLLLETTSGGKMRVIKDQAEKVKLVGPNI